jgi:hypothetical protein
MQQRINRLESLVKTLVAQGQLKSSFEDIILLDNMVERKDDPKTGTNDISTALSTAGTIVVNGGHSVYKAANEWSDVLQEVRISFSAYFHPRIFSLFILQMSYENKRSIERYYSVRSRISHLS